MDMSPEALEEDRGRKRRHALGRETAGRAARASVEVLAALDRVLVVPAYRVASTRGAPGTQTKSTMITPFSNEYLNTSEILNHEKTLNSGSSLFRCPQTSRSSTGGCLKVQRRSNLD